MNNWDKRFFRSAFSEPDGTGSSTRLCIAAVILAAIFWVTWMVTSKGTMPDLGSLTLFVGGVCGTLYGANQYAAIKKQTPVVPPDNPQ